MTKTSLLTRLPLAVSLAGCMLLAGCATDDYDLDEIDATIGIGGGGKLTIPSSSTSVIYLKDVLEMDDEDCIVFDEQGNYVFREDGSEVEPSHPEIDRIHMVNRLHDTDALPLVVHNGRIDAARVIDVFDYTGNKPDDVVEVKTAYTDGDFTLELSFPKSFADVESSIDQMIVELPSFLILENSANNGNATVEGNRFTFHNLSTSRALTISADVTGLNVDVDDENITDNGETMSFHGEVYVAITTNTTAPDGSYGMLDSSFDMGDFDVVGAYGLFDPEIDLTDMGSAKITGIPNFLEDNDVTIDLHNPQVYLTLNSDLDVNGLVSGVIRAYKDGQELTAQRVTIPEFDIEAGGVTEVCICRTAEGIDQSRYKVVEVPELSNIIRTIPDEIRFEGEGRIDPTVPCLFELGRRYNIAPSYYIEAPLSLAADAVIVYTETIDDWNEDISDYELSDDAYIEITGTVENCVPAFLTLTANAIDIDGNIMPESQISVEVSNTVSAMSPASGTQSPTLSPLTVTLKQQTKGVIKRLDGIVLSIKAAATHDGETVTGVTLNGTEHYIKVDDINVSIVGRIIADLN